MNDREFRNRLNQALPDAPEVFHRAMTDTLKTIVREDGRRRAASARKLRRTLLIAALVTLLLASAAVAAYHWKLFDALWFFNTPPASEGVARQAHLFEGTINGVEVAVNEAAYDGRTLYLMWTYRLPDVDVPLGVAEDGTPLPGLTEEISQLLQKYDMRLWTERIWFDGREADMTTAGSGGMTTGTAEPGVIEEYSYLRLDKDDVFLEGKVEVALPIGPPPEGFYPPSEHPEVFDENMRMRLPDEGVITFTLDVTGMADRVVTEHPCIPVATDLVTAQVTEACFSPLMTYITLDLEVNPDAMAAFIEANGDGYYDEEGRLMWPYGGTDVFEGWLYSLSLVDGEGVELFPGEFALDAHGNETAEFIYPALSPLPDELWLAPVEGGAADMTAAVRVR